MERGPPSHSKMLINMNDDDDQHNDESTMHKDESMSRIFRDKFNTSINDELPTVRLDYS